MSRKTVKELLDSDYSTNFALRINGCTITSFTDEEIRQA